MSAAPSKSDGMNYAPEGKPAPVVKPGEFCFGVTGLDHGHIYGMCNGLIEAGAELRCVYDPDAKNLEAFRLKFPKVEVLRSEEELLGRKDLALIASAAIPSERGPLGCRVMDAGKDYFSDKAPFTELGQLEAARKKVRETGRKHMVYYSERLHVECAVFAEELIAQNAIGRVVQVLGLGPHRLNAPSRPAWFFKKKTTGGILCDIGSHQFDQFLAFTGAKDARVLNAAVANFNNKENPEFEDFGEANLVGDNGAMNYIRVDWFTPAGLPTWGDGRTIILGTEGYIELRKYIELDSESGGDQLYLVNGSGQQHLDLKGKVGFRFFGKMIRDCLERTENAMTQEHAFKAAELCLKAQAAAIRIE